MVQSREDVEKTVNDIFRTVFEVEESLLQPGARLQDLGLDSLDAVDLVVSLEKAFKFRIAEDEARKIKTLGDIHENVLRGLEKMQG